MQNNEHLKGDTNNINTNHALINGAFVLDIEAVGQLIRSKGVAMLFGRHT